MMKWLITGCSTGLGLELVRAALDAGQDVIATSRNPAATPDLVAEIKRRGGRWFALDVSLPTAGRVVSEIIQSTGPIDVLINNAGYATGAPLETITEETMQRQFATNVFGAIRTVQAVLPGMRESREPGRTVVNMSSAEHYRPHSGLAAYAATKFAIEAVSESLRDEVAEFGIRVLIPTPGAMRTAFVSQEKLATQLPEVPGAYKGKMVDHVLQYLVSMDGRQDLNPQAVAEVIVNEVLQPTIGELGKPILRMPLGKESLGLLKERGHEFLKAAAVSESIALKCDF